MKALSIYSVFLNEYAILSKVSDFFLKERIGMTEKQDEKKQYVEQIRAIVEKLEKDLSDLKYDESLSSKDKDLAAFKAHKKALFEIKGILHHAGKLLDFDPAYFDELKILESMPMYYSSEMPFQPYLY